MSTAKYVSMQLQPTVITSAGQYRTRAGEIVTITNAGSSYWHTSCDGYYPCGTKDKWHISGRIYQGQECDNDIVEKLP